MVSADKTQRQRSCAQCGDGYPFLQLYEVEGYENTVLICGPCYDKWQYGENLEDRE